jgi:DNA helicase-2/ATP-dependent DNA helicase PcrA
LYRSNVQSRVFEKQLIKYNIPYIIYGGLLEQSVHWKHLKYYLLSDNFAQGGWFEEAQNLFQV